MATTINGIPADDYDNITKRVRRTKILESAALQTMVKLREEGLLASGHAVCVSTYEDGLENDAESYQFVKILPEFTQQEQI